MKNSTNTPRLGRLENYRGQAVIEYTLMLIISVAIVMAMMNLIFKPFGNFISDYMGKYTACLLEYGELPSLGTDNPSEAEEDSECDKKFKPGTLAEGRPPSDSGSSSSGSTKSSGTKSSPTKSNDSSGGGSTYAGSSSRGGSRNISPNRRSFGTESGGARDGKVVEIALDSGANNGFFGSKSNNGRYQGPQRKTVSVGLTGLTEAEKKKLEKKADGAVTTAASESGMARTQKKLPVKPPPERTIAQEDEPWTIGNFIRYLFIAALVIALVIFVGGQALQMSKSGEK